MRKGIALPALLALLLLVATVIVLVALPKQGVHLGEASPSPTSSPAPSGQPSGELKQFKSYSQIISFLDAAGAGSSGPSYGKPMMAAEAGAMAAKGADQNAPAPQATAGTNDYSTTNVQVAGVDEADNFKNDGQYIYTITQGKLVIVKAYPPSDAKVVSVLNDSNYQQMFVDGDKLVAFGSEQLDWNPIVRPLEKTFAADAAASGSAGASASGAGVSSSAVATGQASAKIAAMPAMMPVRCLSCPPFYYGGGANSVKVFDITDRANPKLLKEIDFRGNFVAGRLIGDKVYAVYSEYANRIMPMPIYRIDGRLANVAASDIAYFDYPFDSYEFTTVVGVNLKDLGQEPAKKIVLMGGGNNVFVSLDNAYVTYTRYDYNRPQWKAYEEILLPEIKAEAANSSATGATQTFSLKQGETIEASSIKLALVQTDDKAGNAIFFVTGRGNSENIEVTAGQTFSGTGFSVALSSVAGGIAQGTFSVDAGQKIAADALAKIDAIEKSDVSEWQKDSLKLRVATQFLQSLEDDKLRAMLYQKISVRESELQQENFRTHEMTVVHKFSLGDKIDYLGKAEVPGHVLNQFSMDEYKGNFRIATTIDQQWVGGYGGGIVPMGVRTAAVQEDVVQASSGVAEPAGVPVPVPQRMPQPTVIPSVNNVYVLDGSLKVVGRLDDLAPGERIYSARFIADRAYLVTFRTLDPLFVIDLSDPAGPKVLGKLKIPGYSQYLHPFDETHLIGFGKDAIPTKDANGAIDENAAAFPLGLKLSLFDVSDVANPKEMASYKIGDAGTQSLALDDHRAFLFSKSKGGLLVIPVTLAEVDPKQYPNYPEAHVYGTTTFQGAYVLSVSLEKGFELRGRVSHADPEALKKMGDYYYGGGTDVRRSAYIGDVLYTVSDSLVKANDLSTLAEEASVKLPYEQPYYYGGPDYATGVGTVQPVPAAKPMTAG